MALDTDRIKTFAKGTYVAWKWFLQGLRWLSIIVFAVLFFIGLYVKLPWKMLACLAVIPVVGICVPQKKQPYIWGLLTVILLSAWGWVHLPEHSNQQWQPFQYDTELAKIEREHLPEGINNAADWYQVILNAYGESIFDFNHDNEQVKQETLISSWDPGLYPALDNWISQFEPGIEQMIYASGIDPCRFEIPHNLASLKPQLQRINQLKGWARLMICSANRDLFLGFQARALDKLRAVAGIAQHLYQQQTLFDQSAAFHIELLAARAMKTFIIIHCDDPQVMKEIEQIFGDLDPQWARNWPDILAREKLMAKNLIALMYEVNESGKVRISHSAMMALQAGLGFRPQRLFLKQHEMNRLAVIGLWLALPSSPQRMATIVDERFDHYSQRAREGEQLPRYSILYVWTKGLNAQSVIDWLAMQQVGYFWALDGQFQRHESIVRQIKIFSALKQDFLKHNHWPEKLTDLNIENSDQVFIDALNNQPFVYERTDDSFRLYSVGPNAVDDGGVNDKQNNKDDILLWPASRLEENLDNLIVVE